MGEVGKYLLSGRSKPDISYKFSSYDGEEKHGNH